MRKIKNPFVWTHIKVIVDSVRPLSSSQDVPIETDESACGSSHIILLYVDSHAVVQTVVVFILHMSLIIKKNTSGGGTWLMPSSVQCNLCVRRFCGINQISFLCKPSHDFVGCQRIDTMDPFDPVVFSISSWLNVHSPPEEQWSHS